MDKRNCSICGKPGDVWKGKECVNGHFTCYACYMRKRSTKCQVIGCGEPLR